MWIDAPGVPGSKGAVEQPPPPSASYPAAIFTIYYCEDLFVVDPPQNLFNKLLTHKKKPGVAGRRRFLGFLSCRAPGRGRGRRVACPDPVPPGARGKFGIGVVAGKSAMVNSN